MIDLPKDVKAAPAEQRRYCPANPLAVFRELSGLSQDELSEKSGVHKDTINLLEQGTRGMSYDALMGLSRAMQVEPCDFYLAWDSRRSTEIFSQLIIEIPEAEADRKQMLGGIVIKLRTRRAEQAKFEMLRSELRRLDP